MKAVQLIAYGDVDQLVYQEIPTPEPGLGEVLVKVSATSINPVDWKLRSGYLKERMPLQLPAILGRDVAGEIVMTGKKVMGLVMGSYAEYLVAREDTLAPIPEGMSMEDAAALPLVALTGAQLIENAIKVTAGQTVLVTGAMGGVGRTAIYVAKELGATVIAGVRGKQKADASELGADQVVAIDSDEEIAAMAEVDAIADTVGGETIYKLLPKIKAGGLLGSAIAPPKGLAEMNIRLATVNAQPDAKRLTELGQAAASGKFKIPIAKQFPLSETAAAQKFAEKGGVGGKVLLIP